MVGDHKDNMKNAIVDTNSLVRCFTKTNFMITTHQGSFRSLFVMTHKFLFGEIRLSSFFKRVTSYFSTKPGSRRLSTEGGGSFVVYTRNERLVNSYGLLS